jgi:hypothetical protein
MNKRELYEANMNLQLEDAKQDASSAWEEYHKMKEELTTAFKSATIAWDELDKSHAARAKLHDELVIAEGQRDQWKMRAEKAEKDRIIYLTRWDELLNVYDAAKAWAEVTDPPRTDNYREYREASQRLLDVVQEYDTLRARPFETCFESRRPTVTYTGETWEDTRARCS